VKIATEKFDQPNRALAAARGDRKLAEVREIFTERSSIATSNLLGAVGVALGQILYDDPARQTGFARTFGIVGETILAHGEAVKTKAEGLQYTRANLGENFTSQRLPPEKEEELARPPGQGLTGYATYGGNDEGAAGGEAATENLSEPANPAGSRRMQG
jgi:hypothetical protein